jgi:hypothetical protein
MNALLHGKTLDCRSALAREDVGPNTSDYVINLLFFGLALACP